MRKTSMLLVIVALLALAAAGAFADFDPGPPDRGATAAPVQVAGSGSGVTITNCCGVGAPVMYVVFPPDTPGTPAAAKASAVKTRLDLLRPGQLRDKAAAGNIGYGYVGNGEYMVYVLGPDIYNPAGTAWVKNVVVTVTPHLARFYSLSAKQLAIFLRNRLRGLAAANGAAPGGTAAVWDNVPDNWRQAASCGWNTPTPKALHVSP
ncbi:MAG: hypothetical protein ACLFWB_13400 [Armatimonadota bacterium]